MVADNENTSVADIRENFENVEADGYDYDVAKEFDYRFEGK